MKAILIKADAKFHKALKAAAKADDRSMASLIRVLVMRHIKGGSK